MHGQTVIKLDTCNVHRVKGEENKGQSTPQEPFEGYLTYIPEYPVQYHIFTPKTHPLSYFTVTYPLIQSSLYKQPSFLMRYESYASPFISSSPFSLPPFTL